MLRIHQSTDEKIEALDAWQSVLNQHRNVLSPQLAQNVQDEIDRKRFGVEIERLFSKPRDSSK